MEIKYDYPPFQRALKAMWPGFDGRSVCAVENGAVLGGCGYTPVKNGITYAFILGLRPAWASRALYAAIMCLPAEMGANKIVALCGKNKRSAAVCRMMHGLNTVEGVFEFTREGLLQRAKELLEC